MDDIPKDRLTGALRRGAVKKHVAAIHVSGKLTLLQLSERTCKWPIGDPLNEDFHFCGSESGESSPYCGYHSKLAFQPTAERRRAR